MPFENGRTLLIIVRYTTIELIFLASKPGLRKKKFVDLSLGRPVLENRLLIYMRYR